MKLKWVMDGTFCFDYVDPGNDLLMAIATKEEEFKDFLMILAFRTRRMGKRSKYTPATRSQSWHSDIRNRNFRLSSGELSLEDLPIRKRKLSYFCWESWTFLLCLRSWSG
jgi:hypothetical protein